jgi:SHC-transforming protein 1
MDSEQTFACCFEDETNIEAEIMGDGVNFFCKYIGCIEVFTSMKLLDFQSRSLVAKESINRVCDIANLKSPKKRKVEKRVQQCVSNEACMEHSLVNVVLNISSTCLELTNLETNEVVAR